jgi:hypothetical protein
MRRICILVLAFVSFNFIIPQSDIKKEIIKDEAEITHGSSPHISMKIKSDSLTGNFFVFTDYDYATNNSMRPMVDWADFDNDGISNPIVTAMVRQILEKENSLSVSAIMRGQNLI